MEMLKFIKILFLLSIVNGEEYNLFGEAGQAYSIATYIGNPKQKFNLLVDTGSTTTAVATYSVGDNEAKCYIVVENYYVIHNSTTSIVYHENLEARYSQGMWVGELVSDEISFPSLSNVPEMRSVFAAITKSNDIFMNGSEWQGLLGLAYPPISVWGKNEKHLSWLEAIDNKMQTKVSFSLELCGPQNVNITRHYGNLSIIVGCDGIQNCPEFRTPILYERWFEIGVLGINVYYIDSSENVSNNTKCYQSCYPPKKCMCKKLNANKSILDSGTTNIRLPDEIFRQVVASIRREAEYSGMHIFEEFWYDGAGVCFDEPQEFRFPWISIDLLNADDMKSYFILHIPPQNYMRIMTALNDTKLGNYCYKLGLESGGKDTILGYTAMEGLQILFNRSGRWIGFSSSTCGPNAFLSGPYYVPYSFVTQCDLKKTCVDVSIQVAKWCLLACILTAIVTIIYVYLPDIRRKRRHYVVPETSFMCTITTNLLFENEKT